VSDLRLELPGDDEAAHRLYRCNPVVNRVVSEVARHVPASAERVLRGEYGETLRLPALLVFGTEPDEDMAAEALPECAELTEPLADEPALMAESEAGFDRLASLGGVVANNPLGAPARFRVLDDADETVAEGVEFTDGTVSITFVYENSRPETYDSLTHAGNATADELRFAFDDPRPPTDDRGPVVSDGGPARDRADESDESGGDGGGAA
jgi:hypothetical protein